MAFTMSVAELIAADTTGLLGKSSRWERAPLAQIAEILNGAPFDSGLFSNSDGVPLARIRDVLIGDTSTYYTGPYDETYIIRHGDLLVGMDGDFNSGFWGLRPALLNQRVCKITPDQNLYDIKLLSLALPGYLAAINANTPSVTVKHLSSKTIGEIELPLPSRAEQTRIVAKLEELLSDLEAGVAELKAAQKKLAQYRQSLLEDVSQGTLLGDMHVEETTLGEIVISIGQGWSPKCENHPSESTEQWAVIKTTAIQPLSFDGSHNKELPANLTAREHLELQDGDLLVTRAGPRNRVGITCLVKSPRSKLILCDKAYRLKINEAKALPAFVELVLNSPRALQTIDTLKSGINDSGLNLTQDRFFTLPVKLPTLQAQQLLINSFADANREICDFESVIERSLSQAAAQRQNILRAAFAGELVPQDPSDEPASVLLERIRAERAAQAKPKARGRKKVAP